MRTPVSRFLQSLQFKINSLVIKEYVIEDGGKVLEIGSGEHPIEGVSCPTDVDKKIKNIRVKYADVLDLPFKDKEFDLVITKNFISCFECMDRGDLKEQALNEMRRVGKVVYVRESNPKGCPFYWKTKIIRFLKGI